MAQRVICPVVLFAVNRILQSTAEKAQMPCPARHKAADNAPAGLVPVEQDWWLLRRIRAIPPCLRGRRPALGRAATAKAGRRLMGDLP